MPARLQRRHIPVSQRTQGCKKKTLHILTHAAHAAHQVGVELMLILVTGPHDSPGPTLENRVPKDFQLVASAPSAAAQSGLKGEQRQIAKGLCDGTHRTEKNREVTPPTASY